MEKVFRVTGYQKKDMRRDSTEVTVVSLLMAVLHIYFTLFLSFFLWWISTYSVKHMKIRIFFFLYLHKQCFEKRHFS